MRNDTSGFCIPIICNSLYRLISNIKTLVLEGVLPSTGAPLQTVLKVSCQTILTVRDAVDQLGI